MYVPFYGKGSRFPPPPPPNLLSHFITLNAGAATDLPGSRCRNRESQKKRWQLRFKLIKYISRTHAPPLGHLAFLFLYHFFFLPLPPFVHALARYESPLLKWSRSKGGSRLWTCFFFLGKLSYVAAKKRNQTPPAIPKPTPSNQSSRIYFFLKSTS